MVRQEYGNSKTMALKHGKIKDTVDQNVLQPKVLQVNDDYDR